MSGPEADSVALRQRSAARVHAQVGWCHCLVASARPAIGKWFVEAGRRWGWDVAVCNTPADAERSLVRMRPQLAFVDLERPGGEAFSVLVDTIASECKSLLVVCGNQEDASEEIWARRLGVWFYLPGIQPSPSVSLLFRDARTIVEKRAGRMLPDSQQPVDKQPFDKLEK